MFSLIVKIANCMHSSQDRMGNVLGSKEGGPWFSANKWFGQWGILFWLIRQIYVKDGI